MDSLSQILRSMPELRFSEQGEQAIARVRNHPQIKKLLVNHPELDDHSLKIHMNRLHQYVSEYDNCSNCPGLELCPNDFKGHYTKLLVEQVNDQMQIYDNKVACKKLTGKQAQDAIHRRIHSFYVDDRALAEGYSIAEIIDKDHERGECVDKIVDYILRTKEEGLQNTGLYVYGKFGVGKTFLMCYMLYELAKAGHTGAIVYLPEFIEDLKAMFTEPERMKETIETLKNVDLLVFDDFGAENLNPWARDHVLGAILNYRMNRKPTFYTSNYGLDDLEKHFSFTSKDGEEDYKGQRIMERIRSFVDVIAVNGSNHRNKQ